MNLLTPEKVAEVLSISRSSVRRMIVEGQVPAILLRSGKRKKVWRIREETLDQWLRQRETKGEGNKKLRQVW